MIWNTDFIPVFKADIVTVDHMADTACILHKLISTIISTQDSKMCNWFNTKAERPSRNATPNRTLIEHKIIKE